MSVKLILAVLTANLFLFALSTYGDEFKKIDLSAVGVCSRFLDEKKLVISIEGCEIKNTPGIIYPTKKGMIVDTQLQRAEKVLTGILKDSHGKKNE